MLDEIDLTPEEEPGHSLADPGPFRGVEGRNTVDYMLTSAVAEMSALTAQADMKGSVVITASSIVLSIASTQFGDSLLRWSLVTLVSFILLALLSSVLAVFPKFKIHPEPGDRLPPGFNPLFFGHFARISKRHYLEEMAGIVRDDGAVYRAIVADIHDQGVYLLRAKYRYLRFSYACFLIGFLAAALQLGITEALS
jgi:hypothetical protein